MDTSRALDHFIRGEGGTDTDKVLHRCPSCDAEKRIPMFFELGGWFYTTEGENDAFCEKCQVEMELKKS